ncbi:MAG: DUF4160 domain-containing protein [Bacteroidetes bacterium]|nr:MAG: DUF4160 domain-containing protein [Bacteroidota bacterium]
MPTLLVSGPYRFYFYSHETSEPPHVHVDRDMCSVKFWLEPVTLAKNIGFSAIELNKIYRIIVNNRESFLEEWNEYFS